MAIGSASRSVALVLLTATASGGCMRDEPVTKWKRVEALSSPAILVVQDSAVSFIDVTTTAPPREVFRRFEPGRDINSEIAVDDQQHHVFVTDGERIVQIDRSGNVETVARLHDLKSERPIGDEAQINATFVAGPNRRLYFSVYDKPSSSSFLGELELASATLRGLSVTSLHRVAIDGVRRRAYSGGHGEHILDVADFLQGTTTRRPTAKPYWNLDLAPDGRRLLLSGNALEQDPALGIIDVVTNRETVLALSGSDAAWLNDDVFLFVRGEHELWRHELGSGRTELMFSVRREQRRGASYAHAPVVSRSGKVVAWGFAGGTGGETLLRTIVVDVERGEYRLIDGWWHNTALLEGS